MKIDLNTGEVMTEDVVIPPSLDIDALLEDRQVVATNNDLVATKSKSVATNNKVVATNKHDSVATNREIVATSEQVVATNKRRCKDNAYREVIRFRAKQGTSDMLKQAVVERGFDDMSDMIRCALLRALKDATFVK